MESVKCDVCETVFTDCFSAETSQAYGCASDFFNNEKNSYILSSYGSIFDTSRFIVSSTSTYHNHTGIICDCCIEKLVKSKEIQEDPAFDYWANFK